MFACCCGESLFAHYSLSKQRDKRRHLVDTAANMWEGQKLELQQCQWPV